VRCLPRSVGLGSGSRAVTSKAFASSRLCCPPRGGRGDENRRTSASPPPGQSVDASSRGETIDRSPDWLPSSLLPWPLCSPRRGCVCHLLNRDISPAHLAETSAIATAERVGFPA